MWLHSVMWQHFQFWFSVWQIEENFVGGLVWVFPKVDLTPSPSLVLCVCVCLCVSLSLSLSCNGENEEMVNNYPYFEWKHKSNHLYLTQYFVHLFICLPMLFQYFLFFLSSRWKKKQRIEKFEKREPTIFASTKHQRKSTCITFAL